MVKAWEASMAPPSRKVSDEAAMGEPDRTRQAPSQPRPSVLQGLSVKIEPSRSGMSAGGAGLHDPEGGDEQAEAEDEGADALGTPPSRSCCLATRAGSPDLRRSGGSRGREARRAVRLFDCGAEPNRHWASRQSRSNC